MSLTSGLSQAIISIEPFTLETLTRPFAVIGKLFSRVSVSSCRDVASTAAGGVTKLILFSLPGESVLFEKSKLASAMEYSQFMNVSFGIICQVFNLIYREYTTAARFMTDFLSI